MGWIRDQNPHPSARALAEQMLEDSAAPPGMKLAHLSNMLSKADRGDSSWFFGAGKPWVGPLARQLALEEHEVKELLQCQAGVSPADKSLFVFQEFPNLRPLDLDEEPLPPGLPLPPGSWLLSLGQWNWWTTRLGLGSHLLARKLERESGWVVIEAESWRHALDRLPEHGRLLLVIASADGAPSVPGQSLEGLEAVQVICPDPPPVPPEGEGAAERRARWSSASVGSADGFLARFVAWVRDRLDGRGGLDLDLFETALEDGAEWLYTLAPTFDEAMELFALCDRVGTDTLFEDVEEDAAVEQRMRKVLAGWLRLYAPRIAMRSAKVSTVLKQRGTELLLSLHEARLLALDGESLPLARWREHAAAADARGDFAEEVVRLLQTGEVEAARQLVEAPTPNDIVEGLVALGLLAPDGDDWAASHLVVTAALRSVLAVRLREKGWQGLGALLLDPLYVEDALDSLVDVVSGDPDEGVAPDFARAAALLAAVDPADPRGAAVIDAVGRALAVASLRGQAAPLPLLQTAWDLLMDSSVRPWAEAIPAPSLRIAERPAPERETGWRSSMDAPDVPGLTGKGCWYLGVLGVGRALHAAGGGARPGPLFPWGEGAAGDERHLAWRSYRELAHALGLTPFAARHEVVEDDEAWGEALAVSLLDAIGLEGADPAIDLGLEGELIARAAQGAEIPQPVLDLVLKLPNGLGPLERAADRHLVSLDRLLAWCWQTWVKGDWNHPPIQWSDRRIDSSFQASCATLWKALPLDLLQDEHLPWIENASGAWSCFPEPLWNRILDLLLADPTSRRALGVRDQWWSAMPPHLILGAIEDRRLGVQYHGPADVVWRAIPDRTLAVVDRLAAAPAASGPGPDREPGAQLLGLLFSAPETHAGPVLDRIERWLDHRPAHPGAPTVGQLQKLLFRWVDGRRAEWKRAWKLLRRVSAALPR